MDKKFPESGRLLNLCTRIGLFSLKIRKSSADSGKVGSPACMLTLSYRLSRFNPQAPPALIHVLFFLSLSIRVHFLGTLTTSMGPPAMHSHWGVKGGRVHLWQQKNCPKSGKRGRKSGISRKKRGKIGKRGKIREVLSRCPTWQIGLATYDNSSFQKLKRHILIQCTHVSLWKIWW